MIQGYLTTKGAATYLGVCEKTFRRMVAALPSAKRPRPIAYPGVSVRRWRVADLDSAFADACASAGWDQLVEERSHVTEGRRTRMGRSRGR